MLLGRSPTAVWALLDEGVTSVYCGAEYCIAISPSKRATFSWGWCVCCYAAACSTAGSAASLWEAAV